jgi:porphobilinogen synthase
MPIMTPTPWATFPGQRLRRLRASAGLRDAVADVSLRVDQLIYPLFVGDLDQPRPVASMPGVSQLPIADAVRTIASLRERGLRQFILFGVTPGDCKDASGSFAADPACPVNRTLAAVREAKLDTILYADLCLCEYTDHGHCGVTEAGSGVNNDATLQLYGRVAVAQARAGADVVAPSGMMDGQVGAIRAALDAAGFDHLPILAYSVKYASNLYGPFREAGEGSIKDGSTDGRRGYQMDYRRRDEWRLELAADLAQGADMVMVKPAATYLDVIAGVKREAPGVPLAAYHVSGEYSMLHAAAERGWLDLHDAAMETTLAIRRAGADLIITYFAPQLIEWLA